MTVQQDGQQPLTRRQLRERERAAEAGRPDAVESVPVAAQARSEEPVFKRAADPETVEPVTAPVSVVSEPVVSEPVVSEPAAAPVPAEPVITEAPADKVADTPIAATLPDHPLTRRELRALLAANQAQHDQAELVAVPTGDSDASSVVIEAEIVDDAVSPGYPLPVAAPVAGAEIVVEEAGSAPLAEPTESRTFSPPTGHWSLAAAESFNDILSATEDAHSRSVESSGAPRSGNALIIPSVPSVADVTAPLDATGEILLTGSIDLPRLLGSTGQLPNRFDGVDLDRLYDQPEGIATDADSAPVSATRAISTHEPSRAMIAPPKNRGTRWVPVLAITAGVLAAATGGLFAAGYIFHIF